jgi:Ca2+-binding RTX toxin-like protein
VVTARGLVVVAIAGLVAMAGFATTATNTVANSFIGRGQSAITANALKPPECAALDLTEVKGQQGGKGGAALTLGTPGDDRIVGGGKSDCILGGAGNDRINASGGFDVCLGGPGTDTFQGCEVSFQ